jgi:hypothetical protein
LNRYRAAMVEKNVENFINKEKNRGRFSRLAFKLQAYRKINIDKQYSRDK